MVTCVHSSHTLLSAFCFVLYVRGNFIYYLYNSRSRKFVKKKRRTISKSSASCFVVRKYLDHTYNPWCCVFLQPTTVEERKKRVRGARTVSVIASADSLSFSLPSPRLTLAINTACKIIRKSYFTLDYCGYNHIDTNESLKIWHISSHFYTSKQNYKTTVREKPEGVW